MTKEFIIGGLIVWIIVACLLGPLAGKWISGETRPKD